MKQTRSPLGIYTIAIAALFLAGLLLLVVFGARTYRDAAAVQSDNNRSRALLSYIATCVRSSDREDAVSVLQDGSVLEIADSSGYALYIYCADGALMEQYSARGAELNPAVSTVLERTEVFEVQTPARDTLKVTTDAGSLLLHIRCGEGSE